MKARGLRILLVLSLVMSAFVASIGTSSAQGPIGSSIEAVDALSTGVYFPWVPNGEMLGESGPYYGSVTVQNLGSVLAGTTDLYFYVGVGSASQAYDNTYVVANVQEGASVTVSAEDLGITGTGASVHVVGVQPEVVALMTDLEEQLADLQEAFDNASGLARLFIGIAIGLTELAIEFVDAVNPTLAGSTKNVAEIPSNAGITTASHTTVDGYTGMNRFQVEPPLTDQHVLPIVQTNSGWNTVLRLASFADENNPNPGTAFTVTLYEAGGQGAAGTSSGEFTGTILGGEVVTIDIMDAPGIDEEWVGNAFITSNAPIGVVAERYKTETNMLLTNVSRPVEQVNEADIDLGPADNHRAIAPLVFQNYNYWNTGISIANTSDAPNTVTVNYFTPGGSQVGAEQLTIPPRGMEYIFTPGTQDLGLISGFVGAATITGTGSLHAAVDQVKYFGGDPDVGDAMSYVTEPPMPTIGDLSTILGNAVISDVEDFFGDFGVSPDWDSLDVGTMTVPLVQKGNPATGGGDTTGIQLFNSLPATTTHADVWFMDPTGNLVAPTLNVPISISLSGHQGYTLYTHNYSEMPAGFQGSAVIDYAGGVTAVANNVNYDVQFDGAVAQNAYRYSDVQVLQAVNVYFALVEQLLDD
jgi:hypothetical protein